MNDELLLFVPPLSSCHEKTTVALYFGRIRNRLGVVVYFRVFWLFLIFLTNEFGACSKHQSAIIIVKRFIQGRNNVCDKATTSQQQRDATTCAILTSFSTVLHLSLSDMPVLLVLLNI